MSFEEIFNPSLSHTIDHMNAEKILPAPVPAPGDKPLLGGEDDNIVIPEVTWGMGVLPEPPRVHRPDADDG